MYVWSCRNCMPRSPPNEHTSEEVEVAQREVPSVRIGVETLPGLKPLADEADPSVRRQEAGPQERAPLRPRREGDQRVRVDLGGGAPQQRNALGVRVAGADEVGEEAARHALLHRVADDRDGTQSPAAIRTEAPVGARRDRKSTRLNSSHV